MTPQEIKAKELVEKFLEYQPIAMDELVTEKGRLHRAKDCAIICVDEIINVSLGNFTVKICDSQGISIPLGKTTEFWHDVKQSINNL
jgi:hypothetical protein